MTPGPWHYDKEANVVFRVVGDRDEDIAIVVDKDAGPLISAAPDLLAACEWVAANHRDRDGLCHCGTCATVRAAIRKARGGQ